MATYEKDSDDIVRQLDNVLKQYHGDLIDAGVTWSVLVAKAAVDKNDDPCGPAISVGGYAAAGKVKITPLEQRADGRADVVITIDGDRWDEWSDGEKAALLDHEVTHIELVTKFDKRANKDVIARDDLGRPKLKIRLHDYQFGWFDSIVRRHGRSSFESQQAESFFDEPYKQLWLPFLGDDAGELLSRPAKLVDSQSSFLNDVRSSLVESGVPFVENVTVGGGKVSRKAKA